MKIIAKKDRKLLLINASNTQNENKAETIELTVPEEYEDYNKKIVFVTDNGIVWDIIQDNKYKLTKAITKYNQVDFYIWLTKGDVDFRTETKTLRFYHNEDASDEITPEEISGVNTVINLLEEEIDKVDVLITQVDNIDLDANKFGKVTTIDITKKDGTSKTVTLEDGMGLNYDWQGTSLGVKREDEQQYEYVNLKGEKGDCNFATFEVNNNMELVMNKTEDMLLDFSLSEDGVLSVVI